MAPPQHPSSAAFNPAAGPVSSGCGMEPGPSEHPLLSSLDTELTVGDPGQVSNQQGTLEATPHWAATSATFDPTNNRSLLTEGLEPSSSEDQSAAGPSGVLSRPNRLRGPSRLRSAASFERHLAEIPLAEDPQESSREPTPEPGPPTSLAEPVLNTADEEMSETPLQEPPMSSPTEPLPDLDLEMSEAPPSGEQLPKPSSSNGIVQGQQLPDQPWSVPVERDMSEAPLAEPSQVPPPPPEQPSPGQPMHPDTENPNSMQHVDMAGYIEAFNKFGDQAMAQRDRLNDDHDHQRGDASVEPVQPATEPVQSTSEPVPSTSDTHQVLGPVQPADVTCEGTAPGQHTAKPGQATSEDHEGGEPGGPTIEPGQHTSGSVQHTSEPVQSLTEPGHFTIVPAQPPTGTGPFFGDYLELLRGEQLRNQQIIAATTRQGQLPLPDNFPPDHGPLVNISEEEHRAAMTALGRDLEQQGTGLTQHSSQVMSTVEGQHSSHEAPETMPLTNGEMVRQRHQQELEQLEREGRAARESEISLTQPVEDTREYREGLERQRQQGLAQQQGPAQREGGTPILLLHCYHVQQQGLSQKQALARPEGETPILLLQDSHVQQKALTQEQGPSQQQVPADQELAWPQGETLILLEEHFNEYQQKLARQQGLERPERAISMFEHYRGVLPLRQQQGVEMPNAHVQGSELARRERETPVLPLQDYRVQQQGLAHEQQGVALQQGPVRAEGETPILLQGYRRQLTVLHQRDVNMLNGHKEMPELAQRGRETAEYQNYQLQKAHLERKNDEALARQQEAARRERENDDFLKNHPRQIHLLNRLRIARLERENLDLRRQQHQGPVDTRERHAQERKQAIAQFNLESRLFYEQQHGLTPRERECDANQQAIAQFNLETRLFYEQEEAIARRQKEAYGAHRRKTREYRPRLARPRRETRGQKQEKARLELEREAREAHQRESHEKQSTLAQRQLETHGQQSAPAQLESHGTRQHENHEQQSPLAQRQLETHETHEPEIHEYQQGLARRRQEAREANEAQDQEQQPATAVDKRQEKVARRDQEAQELREQVEGIERIASMALREMAINDAWHHAVNSGDEQTVSGLEGSPTHVRSCVSGLEDTSTGANSGPQGTPTGVMSWIEAMAPQETAIDDAWLRAANRGDEATVSGLEREPTCAKVKSTVVKSRLEGKSIPPKSRRGVMPLDEMMVDERPLDEQPLDEQAMSGEDEHTVSRIKGKSISPKSQRGVMPLDEMLLDQQEVDRQVTNRGDEQAVSLLEEKSTGAKSQLEEKTLDQQTVDDSWPQVMNRGKERAVPQPDERPITVMSQHAMNHVNENGYEQGVPRPEAGAPHMPTWIEEMAPQEEAIDFAWLQAVNCGDEVTVSRIERIPPDEQTDDPQAADSGDEEPVSQPEESISQPEDRPVPATHTDGQECKLIAGLLMKELHLMRHRDVYREQSV
ncbi:hypothetical protein RBB50_011804 [Rhinocladiella similis]